MDPANEAIGKELADLDAQIKRERDQERQICRRMFGNTTPAASIPARRPIQDDVYEELYEQLNSFKNDDTQDELLLPSGFDKDTLGVVRTEAERLGLSLIPGKAEGQFKIIKQKN